MVNDKMETRDQRIYKITLTGSIVNMLLLVMKFMAGILGNSAARKHLVERVAHSRHGNRKPTKGRVRRRHPHHAAYRADKIRK